MGTQQLYPHFSIRLSKRIQRHRKHRQVYYLASATMPQDLHLLTSSSLIHFSITGLSCVPRSVTWNESSWMMVGSVCVGEGQYQRRRSKGIWKIVITIGCGRKKYTPTVPVGRTRSMTNPIVSAKRTGLWGVLAMERSLLIYPLAESLYPPGNKNISPSSILISLNIPSSTTRKSIPPLYW